MVNDFIHNDQVKKKIFLLFGFQYLQSEQCFLFFLDAERPGSRDYWVLKIL